MQAYEHIMTTMVKLSKNTINLIHNPELLKTREGQAIYEHLKQDIHTDLLFQGHIAESYPDAMMNAKQYAVPSEEEQARILYTVTTGDYGYYERLKSSLVEKGAFRDLSDVNREVSNIIEKTTFLDSEQKDRFSIDRD